MCDKREMSAGSDDEVPTKRVSQNSFLKRSLKAIKLRQLLRDIEEARTYGVDIYSLDLGEFYGRLQEARQQYSQHMSTGPGAATFAYDMMEDTQIPWDESGLDELKRKVLSDHDRNKKRRRSVSRKPSKSRRSRRRSAKNH
jgi:hypothetical protein